MNVRFSSLLLVGCLAAFIASPAIPGAWAEDAAVSDEMSDLVKTTKAPARFADHKPKFHIRKETWSVDTHVGPGPSLEEVCLILDGDRHVAVWSKDTGRMDLITSDPSQAPKELKAPVRYHFARLLGAAPTTAPWIWGEGETESREWSEGGERLTMTRKREWKKEFRGHVISVVTLSCDPVLGYLLTLQHEVVTDKKPPAQAELLNIFMANVADPWPGRGRWDLTFYSPEGKEGYRAWANNWVAGDGSDSEYRLKLRSGGLVGFINREGGWNAFVSRTGTGRFLNKTCNVWLDQHNIMTLADQPDKDGMFVSKATFRVGFAPPEVTGHILKNCAMEFEGQAAVMPRLGVLEDFETQPQLLTSPLRGLRMDDMSLSAERVHSGTNSAVLRGMKDRQNRGLFSIAPQIPLDANTKYRIEAYCYVEGEDTEANITADLYRANVHHAERLVRQETEPVRKAGEWVRTELEFTTEGCAIPDPFVDLRLRVMGTGRAFFDDFKFSRLDAVPSMQR